MQSHRDEARDATEQMRERPARRSRRMIVVGGGGGVGVRAGVGPEGTEGDPVGCTSHLAVSAPGRTRVAAARGAEQVAGTAPAGAATAATATSAARPQQARLLELLAQGPNDGGGGGGGGAGAGGSRGGGGEGAAARPSPGTLDAEAALAREVHSFWAEQRAGARRAAEAAASPRPPCTHGVAEPQGQRAAARPPSYLGEGRAAHCRAAARRHSLPNAGLCWRGECDSSALEPRTGWDGLDGLLRAEHGGTGHAVHAGGVRGPDGQSDGEGGGVLGAGRGKLVAALPRQGAAVVRGCGGPDDGRGQLRAVRGLSADPGRRRRRQAAGGGMEQTYDACAFAWQGAALEEGEADESKRGRGEAADQETVGGSRREVWSAMSACMGESGGAEVADVVQWRSRSGGGVAGAGDSARSLHREPPAAGAGELAASEVEGGWGGGAVGMRRGGDGKGWRTSGVATAQAEAGRAGPHRRALERGVEARWKPTRGAAVATQVCDWGVVACSRESGAGRQRSGPVGEGCSCGGEGDGGRAHLRSVTCSPR